MDTFDDVFTAFGGPARLAEAIGIRPFHAQTMKTRRSIPPAYWARIVEAARQRGMKTISVEKLAEMAAARRAEKAREQAA
jgi:hypothetical protein